MNRSRPRPDRRTRGALLIVALILCAIIGLSVTSYIQLGRTSLTVANRALYNNAAMNLAENGLEEAMYAINQDATVSTYSWDTAGWTTSGTEARRKWTGTRFDQNATGEVRVRRALSVVAAGRILNPVTARSQCLGGMTMGIGSALMEALHVDHELGLFVNHDLGEYHVPVHADIPDLDVIFLDEQIGRAHV